MSQQDQIVSGKLYSYYHEEVEKIAVLETFFPVKQTKWVAMDNGDKIPLEQFREIATVVPEGEQFNHNSNTAVNEEVNHAMPQIKMDADGMPILEGTKPQSGAQNGLADIAEEIANHPDIIQPQESMPTAKPAVVAAAPVKAAPIEVIDPVIELIKRAKHEPAPMQLELDIPLFEKDLVSTIVKSFGEESVEKLLDHMITNMVDIDQIKDRIKDKLCTHYDIVLSAIEKEDENEKDE